MKHLGFAIRGEKGFGGAEILLAVGVASAVALGTATILFSNQNHIGLANAKANRDQLSRDARAQLADPTLCTLGIDKSMPFSLNSENRIPLQFSLASSDVQLVANTELSGNLVINKFYLENPMPSGLTGSSGFPVQSGDLYLDIQGNSNSKIMKLRPVYMGKLYTEVNGHSIISCFNNDGPVGAAAMACLQINGQLGSNGACDTSAFQSSVLNRILTGVNEQLYGTYQAYVMGQTDGTLATQSSITIDRAVAESNENTRTAAAIQNNRINSEFNSIGQSINESNANLAYQTNVLWSGTNAASATAWSAYSQAQNASNIATNAANTANYAHQLAEAALGTSNQAVGTANSASVLAGDAHGTAHNAATTATNARDTANWANSIANHANAVAQDANRASYVAWDTANAAYATASSAYNYSTSAYGTAVYSNDVANASRNSANYAVAVADGAVGTANSASGTANWAMNTGIAAYNNPTRVNNYYSTSYDCGQITGGQACP